MKIHHRLTACVLTICIFFSMLVFTTSVAGTTVTGNPTSGFTIINNDGTYETVDESWADRYPYGIFALGNSELVVTEGGTKQVLSVYRMGGTAGKASAIIYYQPAVVQNEDGSYGFSQAISADDIIIEVEDPLPITEYQSWGEPEAPEKTNIKVTSAEGVDGQGEPCLILSLDTTLKGIGSYQWYALSDGQWEKVNLAEGPELPLGQEDLDTYDFRCEFELGGISYCTDSFKGIPYEKPEADEIPEAPTDIVLNPDPTYSQLVLDENNNKYNGVIFEVCFANGEYKKDIIITANDDSEAELDEYATFTIYDSVGGEVHQALNTLMLRVEDIDADLAEPSRVSFATEKLSFDKSGGKAVLTVKRTGGKIKTISVDWSLSDGTAKAGTDYVTDSGTLYFYGDQDEQTIEIQLVNDKILNLDEKFFTVHLSNLLGDDESSISMDTCTVGLYNTNTAEDLNLVSTLYDVEAIDVSTNISEASGAPVKNDIITGSQVMTDEELDLLSGSNKGYVDWETDSNTLDPLLYRYGKVNFSGNSYSSLYYNYNMSLTSKGKESTSAQISNMAKLYSGLRATVYGGAKFASGWDRLWYGDEEYAYTVFGVGYYSGGNITVTKRWDCEPDFWKSGLNIYLYAYNPFTVYHDWNYTENLNGLYLAVDTYESRKAGDNIDAEANVALIRRYFNNDFYLDIYTANDQDIRNSDVSKYTSGNYQGIIQKVEVTQGGTYNGKLTEGSSVRVVLGNTHLKPAAAHIVDSNGSVVLTGSVSGNTATFSNIMLPPDGTYTFRLVLDRTQQVKIDVTPSSETDSSGNPLGGAAKAYKAAYDLLLSKNTKGGKITVGSTNKANGIFTDSVSAVDVPITESNGSFSLTEGIFSTVSLNNVQYINFNLSEEDVILFNGKAYAGNQNIWLATRDLTPSDLMFYFYEENYLTAVRPMKVTLDSVALYFDTNGNGRIDGYFDEESGVFITEGGDSFIAFMDDIDYEETMFRPVVDGEGVVHQYFLRPYYTANPVCLVVPSGHSDSERMQIMPNFITDVTNSSVYESLSTEQKQYRTIVSGETKLKAVGATEASDIGHTSDNKLKYTAKASAYSYIDIPLGGDKNPARQLTSVDFGPGTPQNGRITKNGTDYILFDGLAYYYDEHAPSKLGNAVFVWEPEYVGNLLYKFSSPQPIYIANSIAGSNIPVTTDLVKWYLKTDGTWTTDAPAGEGEGYAKNDLGGYISETRAGNEGREALNNYLGSFGGNDTFALAVYEQNKTTDEILSGLSLLSDTQSVSETITRGSVGTFPDSSYLKQNSGSGEKAAGDSSGKGEMEEFSTDLDSELFSFSSEFIGIFSVETDGYEVTMTVGIPLYSKDNGGGTGSAANTLDDAGEIEGKVKEFIKNVKGAGKKKGALKDAFSNLAGEDLDANKLKSKSVEFTVGVSIAVTLKYNPLDNSYKFSEAAILVSAEIELRLQYRFTPVPIVYVYAQFGAGITVGLGLGQDRVPVYGKTILPADNIQEVNLSEVPRTGESSQFYFTTDKKAFSITFSGKLYMECYEFEDKNGNGKYDSGDKLGEYLSGTHAGYISSDGKEETEIVIKGQDKFDLEDPVVVVLTVMDDNNPNINAQAKITSIKIIDDVDSDFYFSGFKIELEGSIELGIGIGIEIAKVELFAKVNLGVAFGFGTYQGDGEYKAASIEEFSLAGGIGFRVVLLFFNYEMDLIEYHLNYDGDKWTHGWSALGGKFGGDKELGIEGSENDGKIHVYITPPSQVKARVYDNNVTYKKGDFGETAYNIEGVEFQVSGYGSSVNAYKLVDNVRTGYDYRIVTVGSDNYVVYTGTRDIEGVDNTQLMLSKLVVTRTDDKDVYGLVNPVADNSASDQNAIPVDKNDATGDLDFYTWAEGNDIHVIWVSYKEPSTAPVRPEGTPYTAGGTPMGEKNYMTIGKPAGGIYDSEEGQFIQTGSVLVIDGQTVDQYNYKEVSLLPKAVNNPNESDYYSAEPVDGWEFEGDGETGVGYYYNPQYNSLAEAIEAFNNDSEAAEDEYNEAYQEYLEAKACYDGWKLYYDWYNYFRGLDIQNKVVDASRNTVVKHAVFDTTETNPEDALSDSVILSGDGSPTYYFLPQAAGNAAVFAQSVLYSDVSLNEQLQKYRDYLDDTMTPAGSDNSQTSLDYLEASKSYRLAYQQSMLSIYGGNSRLTVTAPDGAPYENGVMYVSKHQQNGYGVAENQTNEILTNIQMTEIDGTYYLAYITQQDAFIKDADQYVDISSISRLYLRTFTIEGNSVEWGDPYLLRTVVNNEQNSSGDGVYDRNLTKTKGYIDPYIANLKFLKGALGDTLRNGETGEFEPFSVVPVETFLLFEMNGNTYVINKASLETITTSGSGTIYPFFTYEQLYGDALEEGTSQNISSGKSEVVIGADGDGNIAAVYIASVPNTVNNAIYISYWDPESGAWSDGVMLAMNYMDVYERSVAEGWDAKTTEAAYFDEALDGGLTSFTFSNIQIALGRKKTEETGTGEAGELGLLEEDNVKVVTAQSAASLFSGFISEMGLPSEPSGLETLGSSYSKAELYALSEQAELKGFDTGSKTADSSELLILTQGLLQELAEYTDSDKTIIAPKRYGEEDGENAGRPKPGKLGLYVISYGKGNQQVGNVSIRFSYNEFTVGSQLHASISFKNVGDASIRGSSSDPATVKLMLYDNDGSRTEMAKWEINEMISPGQTVRLSTSERPVKALSSNLGEGDYFYIVVSEDEEYTSGGTYIYDSSIDTNFRYTFNIEDKPELGIEGLKTSVIGVSDDGDAIIDLSFDVTNRGSKEAEEVFVQFTYIDSYDEKGNATYKPLDLRGSNLYVSQQKLITNTLDLLGTDDLASGIIYLGTDSAFYSDEYYITEDKYNEILSGYYIPDNGYASPPREGWEKGTYGGQTIWYNKRYHISAYAAYTAGQEAVKGWSRHVTGSGEVYYYNNIYESYAQAKAKADEARKADYIITTEAYNALAAADKELWKKDDVNNCYILKAYSDYSEAYSAYLDALNDTTQNIISNYCRTVRGTINVSPDKFNGNVTGSLNIRAEVFSLSSDKDINTEPDGKILYTSEHRDEYFSENNSAHAQIEHKTFISASPKITLAQGNTHRIPVSIRTTTGEAPEIRVVEVEDGADELSTLYYSADSDTDGQASTATGAIIIIGSNQGSGVIHVIDTMTNTTYPVAYRVAEAGEGINIFNDDAQFNFYNKDGSPYKNEPDQSWKFQILNEWTDKMISPYLRDISIGEKDAYFTFETKASKISFDMIGSATVTSNKFPGTFTISNEGKDDGTNNPPTTQVVDFGNDISISHTVTVCVTSSTAYFDIVRLEYAEGYKPNDDITAPGIYWSRSFPTRSSVQTGDTLTFTVYALDDSGLQSFSFNNTSLSDAAINKMTSGLWSYTFNVTENGSYTVSASDTNGNTTARRVDVDWFANAPSEDALPYGQTPVFEDASAYKINEEEAYKEDIIGNPSIVMTADDVSAGYKVQLSATSDEYGDISYFSYDSSDSKIFIEMASPLVQKNGYYMVRADNNNYGTWAAKIIYIDCFESAPDIRVSKTELTSPNGFKLAWTATKDEESTAKLASVTINGINVSSGMGGNATTYSGIDTVLYGGLYEYRVEDTKGVRFAYRVDEGNLKVPIDISDRDSIIYVNPWAQPKDGFAGQGSITVDFSKITGGQYTSESAAGAASLDEYCGRYEAIVLSAAEYEGKDLPGFDTQLVDGEDSWLTDEIIVWDRFENNESNTWNDLKAIEDGEGKYMVIIRDAQNPKSYSTMACREITLYDNSIDCVSLTARLASSSSASDGEVYVSASKGYTGSYEFAILPLEVDAENSTDRNTVYKTRTIDDFKAPEVKWQLTDWNSPTFSDAALTGLAPGRYQVAVRSFITGSGTEMLSLSELSALGYAPDEAGRNVEAIENEIKSNVTAMTGNISSKSDEWRTASENAYSLQADYEELYRRREKGDPAVTSADVDAAFDSWQEAVAAEEAARTDYLDAFTGATVEQKDNFEDLRANWLSSVTYEEKNAARKIYEQAVYEYCLAYCTAEKSEELTEARNAYDAAKETYDNLAEELLALSATEYESDERYWDSLITGEALQITVKSGDGTSLKAVPSSSMLDTATGKIQVTAYGGSAYDGGDKVHYQFAFLSVEDEESAADYSGNMSEIGNLGLSWQFADNLESDSKTITFTGLAPGWYQVFVRPVYDHDLRDGYDINTNLYDSIGLTLDLASLKKAVDDASAASQPKAVETVAKSAHELFLKYQKSNSPDDWDAYIAAIEDDMTVKDTLENWLAADPAAKRAAYDVYWQALYNHFKTIADTELRNATFDYNLKAAELKNYAEQAYSKAPGNYESASFATVKVGVASAGTGFIGGAIGSDDIIYGDGEVTYRIEEGATLSPAVARRILDDNRTQKTVLIIGTRRVVIPAGKLYNEEEVSQILSNFTGGAGNVIEYTDPDGNTRIIPISMNLDGEVAYLYSGAGTYRLIEATAPDFSDTTGHWASDSIAFAATNGLFNGVGENRFAPNRTMTRAMLATVLYRLIGQPEPGNDHSFKDVDDETWYSEAVTWAYNNGIVGGVGDNLFAPDRPITRAELITMIYRFINVSGFKKSGTSELDQYPDGGKIPDYAREAFEWAVGAGIINGNDKGMLQPLNNATRAEVAAIFERLIRYILQ